MAAALPRDTHTHTKARKHTYARELTRRPAAQRTKEVGRHTAFSSGDAASEPLRQAKSSLKALQQRMEGMTREHEAERRLLNDKLCVAASPAAVCPCTRGVR